MLNMTKLIEELLLVKIICVAREKGQMSSLKCIRRNSGFDCRKNMFDNLLSEGETFLKNCEV